MTLTVKQVSSAAVVPEVPPNCGAEALFCAPVRIGKATRDHVTWNWFTLDEPGEHGHHWLVFASTGGGKALALDTPLPTPTGWTTMGDVQPGDQLLDNRGRSCAVTHKSPVHYGNACYRLTFTDGAQIVADADHLWTVATVAGRAAMSRERGRRGCQARAHWGVTAGRRIGAVALSGVDEVLTIPQLSATFGARYEPVIRNLLAGVPPDGRVVLSRPYRLDRPRQYTIRGFSRVKVGTLLARRVASTHNPFSRQQPQRPQWETVTTADIAAAGVTSDGERLDWAVPIPGPLDLPDADLPIPPYTLGVWLGDGTTRDGRVSIADRDLGAIRDGIEADGLALVFKSHGQNCQTYAVPGLRRMLAAEGLLGDKHIPDAYMRASAAQRLALLRGLMDTDGHATPRGKVEITFKHRHLTEQTRALAQTLGDRVGPVQTKAATISGRYIYDVYRISWTPRRQLFSVPFKADRLDGNLGTCRVDVKMIEAIEPVPSVPTQCVQVGSPDGLYLAGRDLTVTHNTSLLDVTLANLAPRPATALVLIDPKETEFAAWKDRATTLALGPESALQAFELVVDEIRRRKKWCTAYGLGALPLGLVETPDGRMWLWPRLDVFIDELAELTLVPPSEAAPRVRALARIGNTGRAFGVGLVCCTQSPDAKAIPTQVQQSLLVRIGLRCTKPQQLDSGFGTREMPWSHPNVPASSLRIPARTGQAWVMVGDNDTAFVQVAFLPGAGATEMEVKQKVRARAIAAGTAHLRMASPGGEAARDPETGEWVCVGPTWPHVIEEEI